MRFSKTTGCFYPENIDYTNLPADLIDATPEDAAAAMARPPGATLDVVAGRVVVVPAPPPPPPPIPTRVTMRQARRALYDAGLLDHVNAAVAAFPGDIGDKARIDWEYAQDIKRDDPIVQAMIPSLGLTEPQLDALFTAAAAL